jgi:hypothetical protein
MRIQTRRQQIQELQTENRRLAQVQELLVDNILAIQESDVTWTGNRYKSHDTAVTEVAKKYSGTSDWGVLQVGNIVDLRAAYIIGQGLKVSKVEAEGEDATPEYEFVQRFIDKSELDHELAQSLAREAEIEGKTLIKLFPMKSDEEGAIEGIDIAIRWVSWTTNKYTVKVSASDYLQLESVEWNPPAGATVTLTPEQCVYKRFGGRLDVPNETMPRVAKCLTQIENLDMALRDWRQINKLYAAPTPHVQCDNAQQAKEVNDAMDKVNWKIGKFFAHTGVFGYAQPSSEGQKAIESEIITLMKLISGTTGVPIHFLGAPELTTKYGAASEGLLELIAMSTGKEREVWRGAYQEIIEKAMLMWNRETGKTPLRPEMIKVDIPVVTAEQWERIVGTWLPMKTAGEITRKTFLSQVPGLDVEAEMEALEKEDTGALDKFTNQPDPNADPDAEDQPPAGNVDNVTGQVLRYKSNPGNFAKKGARQ